MKSTKKQITCDNTNENIQNGDITFGIIGPVERKLKAFMRYTELLDFVLSEDEKLNTDGAINMLLDKVLDCELKKLAKQHGYTNQDEFIEKMLEAKDGKEAHDVIVDGQLTMYKTQHQEILSHIPVPEDQMVLPFTK